MAVSDVLLDGDWLNLATSSSNGRRVDWADRFVWVCGASLCFHEEAPAITAWSPRRTRGPSVLLEHVEDVAAHSAKDMKAARAPKELQHTGFRVQLAARADDPATELLFAAPSVAERAAWIEGLRLLSQRAVEAVRRGPTESQLAQLGVLQCAEVDRRLRIEEAAAAEAAAIFPVAATGDDTTPVAGATSDRGAVEAGSGIVSDEDGAAVASTDASTVPGGDDDDRLCPAAECDDALTDTDGEDPEEPARPASSDGGGDSPREEQETLFGSSPPASVAGEAPGETSEDVAEVEGAAEGSAATTADVGGADVDDSVTDNEDAAPFAADNAVAATADRQRSWDDACALERADIEAEEAERRPLIAAPVEQAHAHLLLAAGENTDLVAAEECARVDLAAREAHAFREEVCVTACASLSDAETTARASLDSAFFVAHVAITHTAAHAAASVSAFGATSDCLRQGHLVVVEEPQHRSDLREVEVSSRQTLLSVASGRLDVVAAIDALRANEASQRCRVAAEEAVGVVNTVAASLLAVAGTWRRDAFAANGAGLRTGRVAATEEPAHRLAIDGSQGIRFEELTEQAAASRREAEAACGLRLEVQEQERRNQEDAARRRAIAAADPLTEPDDNVGAMPMASSAADRSLVQPTSQQPATMDGGVSCGNAAGNGAAAGATDDDEDEDLAWTESEAASVQSPSRNGQATNSGSLPDEAMITPSRPPLAPVRTGSHLAPASSTPAAAARPAHTVYGRSPGITATASTRSISPIGTSNAFGAGSGGTTPMSSQAIFREARIVADTPPTVMSPNTQTSATGGGGRGIATTSSSRSDGHFVDPIMDRPSPLARSCLPLTASAVPATAAAADDDDDEELGEDAHDDDARRRVREADLLYAALAVQEARHRGAHAFTGVRPAGWVTKPPTVTSALRRAVTGSKWVRQFLWLDTFGAASKLHYGAADGDAHRSIPLVNVSGVGAMSEAELKASGCPTAAIDSGFTVAERGGGRTIHFAVEGADIRDGWVAAIAARARHAALVADGDDVVDDYGPALAMQLTVLLAHEIDQRERIEAAEANVRNLFLHPERRKMMRRLRRLGFTPAAAAGAFGRAGGSVSPGADSTTAYSVSTTRSTRASRAGGGDHDDTSSVASSNASSFQSWAGTAYRGMYVQSTYAASVRDDFASRGTWLYKTTRRKVGQGDGSGAGGAGGGTPGSKSKAGGIGKFLSGKMSEMLTTWTKRYVRVRNDTLVYSAEEHDDVKGTIPLIDIVDVGLLEPRDLVKLSAPFKYGFVLRTHDHENVWCCESVEVRDAWACALERQLLEDADHEREEHDLLMRPRIGVMEIETRIRGDIEDAAKATLADARNEFAVRLRELHAAAEAEEEVLRAKDAVETQRSGSANIPRVHVPPPHLEGYCRSLARIASRELGTSLTSTVFDSDGLCVTQSGEHPQMYASVMAALVDVASQLHPNPPPGSHGRVVPDAIAIETDRKLITTTPIDDGLFACTVALPRVKR